MRILHVVTLAAPDGAFGGPLRVAMNQCDELRLRGHDTVICGAWTSDLPAPSRLQTSAARLFRARQMVPRMGFPGLLSPGLLLWLWRQVRQFDLIHVHAGRDLVSLSALSVARLRRVPYVTQTHGMVIPDPRAVARVLDRLLTRRLLAGAAHRFVLNAKESADLAAVLGPLAPLQQLDNGVPVPAATRKQPPEKDKLDVLFCARLQERKRPVAFVQMADLLRSRGLVARYSLVGPDEGALRDVVDEIARRGLDDVVAYEGAMSYNGVLARIAAADIFVLPSVNEPAGMSLLEALSFGVPSVCTDSNQLADRLTTCDAVLVCAPAPEALAAAVARLLTEPELRTRLAGAGPRYMREQFGMETVGDALVSAYSGMVSPSVIDASGPSRAP